jgi:predicted metalloprotease with PDZ domain
VAIAQHLMRAWIGGELRFLPREGAVRDGIGEAESLWFSDGFARYFAGRALRRLGLISVEDARDFANGLLSAQATSPHRGKDNGAVSALAATAPVARAHAMAHGALYAMRLASLLRARSKGETSLESVVAKLVDKARTARGPLPLSAWTDAITAELGAHEGAEFERIIGAGEDVELSPDALGPCFRGAPGEYTAFDLGFDMQATLDAPGRTMTGLAGGGPAAKAGVQPTDVLEDATLRHGHPEVPVVLTLGRDGRRVTVQYAPKGARGKGAIFTRKTNMPDPKCGDVL